jgi:hypothetical protein
MPSLLDPSAKMDRAKIHLDALDSGVLDWARSETERCRVSANEELERSQYVLNVSIPSGDAQLPLAMIAGDFISCLRSTLDHVAWQLATLTTPNPSTSICFPIYGIDSLDAHTQIAKSTFQLPDRAVPIIKSLQPYKSGNGFKRTHLWRLHKLWNIDKHRHLLLHTQISDVILSDTLPVSLRPTEIIDLDDGKIMRFPIAATDLYQAYLRGS